jgi:hypothetical protein
MLRNGRRVRAREMKGVEGWNEIGMLLLSFSVNAYLVPHTHVQMNCNIINISNKTHF